MWPPRRPSERIGRSRFTGAPAVRAPRLDRPRVSPITSALNSPSLVAVTVRHTPLMAIESPRDASPVTIGPRTVSRAESPLTSTPTTSPSSSTIPVNTVSSSGAPLQLGALPCLGLRGRISCANADVLADRTLRTIPADTAHVLPPIRTLTVGPGISPDQPADGLGRVADCHRRFGVSPTPEHACLPEPVCHAGYSAVASQACGLDHPAWHAPGSDRQTAAARPDRTGNGQRLQAPLT